jgi:sugar transferase (PEP-CTERM/EpsH1 system associated)
MRILWLKTELLHPVDKGGKIRTYHMLKEMKREHHVTYLTLDDGTASAAERAQSEQYCHELVCVPHRTRAKFSPGFYVELASNLASSLPYFLKKYESREMRQKIEEYVRRDSFDVVVCDFLVPVVNMPRAIPCASVLFQHNVEAMIWERHYKTQTNPVKKLYLHDQWRKTRAFEKAACHRFDAVVAVSREDREAMQRDYGVREVVDIPTGVDTDFFRPGGAPDREPHGLVFTGSMDWIPNEDAITYFTRDILPRIRQQVPDVTLTVVGRNPSAGLRELSERDPSIRITGRVDDVRPYMERAAAYIVPIRIGGGTRLKIYEAMAMEKPVVSTTVGAEGLPVRDGEELLLADEPEQFADAVVRVITDDNLAREIGNRAAVVVRRDFGWERVADSFLGACENAVRSHESKSARVELEMTRISR